MAPAVVNVCFAIIRWTPVVFISAVIVWSYYAYVIQMCIFSISNIPEKVIYLLLYHPILFIFGWAYWKTIFADPGAVPKEFFLSRSDVIQFENEESEDSQRSLLERVARNLPAQCRTLSGAVRFCEKCKCIKPDRAHHCSVCGKCILKMDHHCPWVNNCVNFTNYKFFILFLGYGLIYCLYIAATSIQYFIKFWTEVGGDGSMANLHIVFLFFASIMFSISLVSLFCYHIFLTCSNRSTLESFRPPVFRSGPDKDGFSLGRYNNFIEVFGDEKKYWFLPVFTSFGDGVSFSTRSEGVTNSYNSMDETVTTTPAGPIPATVTVVTSSGQPVANGKSSFGDGVSYPVRTIDEDYDQLLGERQRWMEDGDGDVNSDFVIAVEGGYENQIVHGHT